MDITQWNHAEAMHDNQMIDNATRIYAPAKVGETWDGEDVFQGDDIWELQDGEIVFNDTDALKDYIRAEVKLYGGIDKYAKDVLGEKDATEFIFTLLDEPLDIASFIENFYDGNHKEAAL